MAIKSWRKAPKSFFRLVPELLKEHHKIIKHFNYTVDIEYNEQTDDFDYYYQVNFKDNLAGQTRYFNARSKKIYEARAQIAKQLKEHFGQPMYEKKAKQ